MLKQHESLPALSQHWLDFLVLIVALNKQIAGLLKRRLFEESQNAQVGEVLQQEEADA